MSGHDHIVLGQELTVTFGSIPSSGYRWVVQDIPEVLVLVSEFFQDQEDEEVFGGHVLHSLTFKALKIGTWTLDFKLQRPWEPGPLKTYSLEVLVT